MVRSVMVAGSRRLISSLIVAAFCLPASPILAADLDWVWRERARDVLVKLEDALDEDLPSAEQALPGYRAPDRDAPFLAYSNFSTDASEPDGLGTVVTLMLMWRLAEAADHRLATAPLYGRDYHWAVNAEGEDYLTPGQNQAVFLQRLHERAGADFGLRGSLAQRGERLEATLTLKALPSGPELLSRKFSRREGELSRLIEDMARPVLTALEIPVLNKSPLAQLHPRRLADLREFAAAAKDPSSGHAVPILRDLASNSPFPTGYLWLAEYSRHAGGDFLPPMEQAVERWPDHASLKFLLARSLPRGEKGDPNRRRTGIFTDLAARYPDNLEFQFYTIHELGWCCHTREALGLARSVIARAPDHYKAWIALAMAIEDYAWRLRGNHMWGRVPERGKRQFPKLIEVGGEAADHALMLNEYTPASWRHVGQIPPGYSKENEYAFTRAVELAPHSRDSYASAIYTLGPKWGGSVDVQMHFFNWAIENNPEAQWPFEVYEEAYVKGPTWRVRGAALMNKAGCGLQCRTVLGYASIPILLILVPLVGVLLYRRFAE